MAEESNDPLLNIETNEIDSVKICVENPASVNNGSSTQSRGSVGDNARSNSGGKPDPPKIRQKAVPHYLRASTGSCHDLCKYGKRHASEETPKKPLRIRRVKSSSNHLDSLETMVSGEELKNELEKEKVVKIDPSADTKRHSVVVAPKSHPPKLRASLDSKIDSLRQSKARLPNLTTKKSVASSPPEVIKREIVSTSRKAEVPSRDGDSVGNKMSRRDKKTNEHSVKQSSPVIKAKTSSVSGNSNGKYGKGRRNSDVVTGKKMGAPILNAKKPLVPKTTSVKARKPKPLSHKTSKSEEDSEKILHVVETGIETDAIPALPSPSSPSPLSHANCTSREKHDEDIKFIVNEGDGLVSDNIVRVEIVKVQPDDDDEINDDVVAVETNEEQSAKESLGQTLRMETEEIALEEAITDDLVIQDCPSPLPQRSLSLPNSPSLLSLDEEDEEISEEDESIADKTISLPIGDVETVEENLNKIPRKKRAVLSEDKYNSPMKLKFRSGRTIDLQPVNNNTPRRLKFRRARTFDNKADESVSNNNKSIKADESVSTANKSIEIGNVQDVKETNNKNSRKGKAIASEDKYRPPQSPRSAIKLFRSVKVGSHQSGSTNNSRRLRFSQARVVTRAEDGKSDSSKRALRKIRSKDDLYGAGLSSRKVMLKHQDMQGKRDEQGLLFNNVIEETASKLVESRKSKVKALVGAFETVISLQERKPAMRTVG